MDAERREMKLGSPLSAAAVSALHQGNKIEAIKITREERNIGLKEAKDAVEEFVQSQPTLQASLTAAQAETKKKALLWFAVLVGLAFLGYHFFASREALRLALAGVAWLGALCH